MSIEEIVDNLEIYTVGRPKKDRLFMTVEELQNLIDEIETLEQEPCEDAISRQEVLDEINRIGIKAFETYNDYSQLYDFVDTLPPVTPQPKMGRWVYTGDYITEGMLKCSECGFEHDVSERFSYCPNCGIKMQEVE